MPNPPFTCRFQRVTAAYWYGRVSRVTSSHQEKEKLRALLSFLLCVIHRRTVLSSWRQRTYGRKAFWKSAVRDTVPPACHHGCSWHQYQVFLLTQLGVSHVVLLKAHPKDCSFQNLKVPRGGCAVSGLNATPSSRFVLLPPSHAVTIFDLCRKRLWSPVLKWTTCLTKEQSFSHSF